MCEQCRKENPAGLYNDEFDDLSMTEFVFYALVIPPMLAYVFIKDAIFGGARRRAREERTKLTREQKRIFKEWSGR